ncbi:MAG: hypothetical protein OQL28_07970 [Sedimenticola sp.]|nr:hypothetical protein [Sedimenticola sp.]
MIKRLLFFTVIATGAYLAFTPSSVEHAPGVLVDNAPQQSEATRHTPFSHKGFQLTPLADFQLQARVLGTENYSLGRESELSPLDLALGWGPMSDSAVLEQIDITQGGRFYHWSAKRLPVPRTTIISHSANMHMVPADSAVERELKRLRRGDIISLQGELIRADAPDGWHWVSSMTRDDSGNGACELVWVREVALLDPSQ